LIHVRGGNQYNSDGSGNLGSTVQSKSSYVENFRSSKLNIDIQIKTKVTFSEFKLENSTLAYAYCKNYWQKLTVRALYLQTNRETSTWSRLQLQTVRQKVLQQRKTGAAPQDTRWYESWLILLTYKWP
jgi:hypothetical protein